jgi:hypothetical protein
MNVRIIPMLSFSCGVLTLLYIGLVSMTIFYATVQTQGTTSVRNAESAIANLETQYYSTMNQITNMNPATVGFVQPAVIKYVSEAQDGNPATALSFAHN